MRRIYEFLLKNLRYLSVVAFVFLFHALSIFRKFAWADETKISIVDNKTTVKQLNEAIINLNLFRDKL